MDEKMLISDGDSTSLLIKSLLTRWAGENVVVNEYELDECDLTIHRFDRDTDWFRYIFNKRRLQDDLEADGIIGPIANDTIFDTLGIISSGYLKPVDAIKLLMIGPEYTQVAIKTKKAANQLRWIGSERIERIAKDDLKAEQDTFQEAFGAELGKIVGE